MKSNNRCTPSTSRNNFYMFQDKGDGWQRQSLIQPVSNMQFNVVIAWAQFMFTSTGKAHVSVPLIAYFLAIH